MKIDGATQVYGDFKACDHISLDIKEGEFFTLLGPSGCGKTTLLRMIAGFNPIDEGKIYFNDKEINHIPADKRNIGMVFQNYAIFPHMTVQGNVEYGLKARKIKGKEQMGIRDSGKTTSGPGGNHRGGRYQYHSGLPVCSSIQLGPCRGGYRHIH